MVDRLHHATRISGHRSSRHDSPTSYGGQATTPGPSFKGGETDIPAHAPSPLKSPWLVTWLFAILPLVGWWLYGLFDMDEGFYGAVVAEMNRRGEWITPYYNGPPWFEKPILLYWLAKPSMMLFGDWFGPRLPSVLATIGTYALIAWFAKRRWDDQTARWCVLVAASSILIVGVGRMMMTDALLDFCLVGAFVTFWESLVSDRRWRLLSAFFLGLSVLAKGPVGILLFVPVAGWTFWRERELRPAFRGAWLAGTAILAVTIASWYVPAYLVNGHEFVQKFLVEQNLDRFTGGDPAHTLPFLTGLPLYFVVLLVGMAPWSFYVVKAWPRDSDPLQRYLAVWVLVPFIFFTISKAKLPHYVLPCAPPLAMLVGTYLARRSPVLVAGFSRPTGQLKASVPELLKLKFPLIACLMVAIIANAGFLYWYRLSGQAEVHRLALYVKEQVEPNEDVAAYQMPRRQHDLGTGEPTIQETSLPSIAMYLDRVVNEPDDLATVLSDPRAQWVITRANRISPSDRDGVRQVGRDLFPSPTPWTQDLYRLYYLSAASRSRTRF